MPRISILMPTYNQATFIVRSLKSLYAQSMPDWELLIVDDHSLDDTAVQLQPFLNDFRIRYFRLKTNSGLGAALNFGLERAQSPLIAYLPSDDVYYPEHLQTLIDLLDQNPDAVMAYSGVRHHYNRTAPGQIPGYPIQLVQAAHRATLHRWVERDELVTDDLERMFWGKLCAYNATLQTGKITCEWVDHPHQRHKLLQEPEGGINRYRQYYQVQEPLRFHSTTGNFIDEGKHYRQFRERPDTPPAPDGLKILLVGELAYNPERVLALEERGHRLYGLWMRHPYWYNTVGPLPFGHVRDLPYPDWKRAVRKLKPDVIYALLNWQAVPFVNAVLNELPDIPFVWHFKEGPFICLEKGTWPQLVEIYTKSDGQIFTSPEMQAWFDTLLPDTSQNHPTLLLDGDLPKRDWFQAETSPLLSAQDREFHTVVPGRPIGLHPSDVMDLAHNGIHLHFYGNFTQNQWLEWIDKTVRLAPRNIHLHSTADQEDWVREFSQYDAGWLHYFKSENEGEIRRSNWDDLNYPARLATLVAAGLPLLQRDNTGSRVATQSLVRSLDLGLFFSNMHELHTQLDNPVRMAQLRKNVWRQRELFTFDAHADELVRFFRTVIETKNIQKQASLIHLQWIQTAGESKGIKKLS
jgi:glycosyltransferase involved in cell wall biosynthesis